MKRFLLLSLALMVALAACAPAAQTPAADALKVSNGAMKKPTPTPISSARERTSHDQRYHLPRRTADSFAGGCRH